MLSIDENHVCPMSSPVSSTLLNVYTVSDNSASIISYPLITNTQGGPKIYYVNIISRAFRNNNPQIQYRYGRCTSTERNAIL